MRIAAPYDQSSTDHSYHRVIEHEKGRMGRTNDVGQLPALLTIPRAAEILGFSRASAYRYAASGELPTKRFGGRVYVITAQIRHLFDAGVEAA